jgi:hypothetical protein
VENRLLDFKDFAWFRATDYVWRDANPLSPDGRSVLGVQPLFSGPGRIHQPQLRPLELNTGLFKEFAEVAIDLDSIAAFAKRYGPLGIPTTAAPPDWSDRKALKWLLGPRDRAELTIVGEAFGDWVQNMAAMRLVMNLWDALRERDKTTLSRLMKRTKDRDGHGWCSCVSDAVPSHREVSFSGWFPDCGTLAASARTGITRIINNQLQPPTRPPMSPELKLGDDGGWSLNVPPRSLADALWLQCAMAIASNPEFYRCKICGRYFEVSKYGSRLDRKTCGTACRSRAHRARKGEAVKLAARGMKPGAIARELKTTATKVRTWLRSQKGN